jgi:hypothetical protein
LEMVKKAPDMLLHVARDNAKANLVSHVRRKTCRCASIFQAKTPTALAAGVHDDNTSNPRKLTAWSRGQDPRSSRLRFRRGIRTRHT